MVKTAQETWKPISASDAEIEKALADANVPALMNALVHITGDLSIIEGDIQLDTALFGDPQGGISEENQARIRQRALEALKKYRDDGCKLPASPDGAAISKMIDFIVGQALPQDYVEFLMTELAMDGQDPYGQPGIEKLDAKTKSAFNVLIIGAGMSGLLAAIRLKDAGIPFTIVEKNDSVGGTWYENTYPGCRVDSSNHSYSYSFAQKDWPQHYSQQQVLLEYFNEIASDYHLRESIQFGTEVKEARFDESEGVWRVTVNVAGKEHTLTANAVISAVGQLNRPSMPDIKGMDSFKGPSFHSARWQHEHALKGKKVLVIGTGASAFQFVPVIAEDAAEITIFQRTPPWVVYRQEYMDMIPDGKHWLLNHVPFYAKWFRFLIFWNTSEGLLASARRDPAWNQEDSVGPENEEFRKMLMEYIDESFADRPDLKALVTPRYPPAGKRMLVDNGSWYKALKRDNVKLTEDRVAEITPTGLRTESGTDYEADVIIYGTGFLADRFLHPMKIYGRSGVELHDQWDGDPRAYLGVTIPNFPNLFCMYGPNTNIVVNGSIIFFSECEMRYIMGCIKMLLEKNAKALDCKKEVHDEYNQHIDEGNLGMAWGSPNVNSWYKNDKGRVTQNWPFTLREYWSKTKGPKETDYHLL